MQLTSARLVVNHTVLRVAGPLQDSQQPQVRAAGRCLCLSRRRVALVRVVHKRTW
jgi:hypothetical protein